MEATEKDGDPADLWVTLEAMGYNRMLELVEVLLHFYSLKSTTNRNKTVKEKYTPTLTYKTPLPPTLLGMSLSDRHTL